MSEKTRILCRTALLLALAVITPITSWLITSLIGSTLAVLIWQVLKKALRQPQ